MKRVLGSILLALGIASGVGAQAEWSVTEGGDGRALFTAETRYVSLSPDGTMLAGISGDAICIFRLASEEETCFPSPDNAPRSLPGREYNNPLVWSPDSRYIAFTEELYIFFEESDVWELDITTGTITNRTDDGIYDDLLDADEQNAPLDYLPAYGPNGELYFFRTQNQDGDSDSSRLSLQRLDRDADEPVEVVKLVEQFPTRFSVFYRPAVSPDGAFIVFPVQSHDPEAPENGLWLIDLTTGNTQRLADSMDGGMLMPEHALEFPFYFTNPVWTADSRAVVVKADSFAAQRYATRYPQHNYLYIGVETGDIVPLFDFSDFPEGAEQFDIGADGLSPLITLPREGALSADGTAFVFMQYDLNVEATARLAVLPLPPDGSEPQVISSVTYETTPYAPNPMMGADGTVVLGGWVYTLERGG